MNEHFYIAAVVTCGAVLLVMLVTAMLALLLGRGLRAHGVARIGEYSELSVRVELPAADANARPPGASEARRTSLASARPLPSSPGACPTRRARIAGGAPARVLTGTDAEAEAEAE